MGQYWIAKQNQPFAEPWENNAAMFGSFVASELSRRLSTVFYRPYGMSGVEKGLTKLYSFEDINIMQPKEMYYMYTRPAIPLTQENVDKVRYLTRYRYERMLDYRDIVNYLNDQNFGNELNREDLLYLRDAERTTYMAEDQPAQWEVWQSILTGLIASGVHLGITYTAGLKLDIPPVSTPMVLMHVVNTLYWGYKMAESSGSFDPQLVDRGKNAEYNALRSLWPEEIGQVYAKARAADLHNLNPANGEVSWVDRPWHTDAEWQDVEKAQEREEL